MAQQIYIIIKQNEIMAEKIINPNNWKRLQIVTTSQFNTNDMTQHTAEILFAYWIVTTIIGVYWMIKNPRPFDDQEQFSIVDIISRIFPAMCLAWFLVPIYLLDAIKFKR